MAIDDYLPVLGSISARFNKDKAEDADFTFTPNPQAGIGADEGVVNRSKFNRSKVNRPTKVKNNYGSESSKKFRARMNRRKINEEAKAYRAKAASNTVETNIYGKGPNREKIVIGKNPKSSIFPGRKMGGRYTGEWGIDSEEAKVATAGQMFDRARTFAFGGSGYKREALRNSFGILSKQQRRMEGFGGFATSAQNALIAYNIAGDAWNGDFDDIGIDAGTYFGGVVGFRVGQALGTGFGKLRMPGLQQAARSAGYRVGALNAGNLGGFFSGPGKSAAVSIMRTGRVAGLVGAGVGAITGAAVVGGAAAAVFGMVTSNNMLNKAAYAASKLELNHNFFETEQSMTMRQRGLQAISKSAMNNRGQLLGNEASVLAFGY